MNRCRVRLTALLLVLPLLSGCGAAGGHGKAITDAIVSYSDYYIEVRNLDAQVREQYKAFDPGAAVFDYTITADIPDYTRTRYLTPSPIPFQASDLSAQNAAAYQAAIFACAATARWKPMRLKIPSPHTARSVFPLRFRLVRHG